MRAIIEQLCLIFPPPRSKPEKKPMKERDETRAAVNDLTAERHAAEALRTALEKLPGIDEETLRDTIEGATNLHEQIARAAQLFQHTDVMLKGLKTKIEQFEARRKRYENRADYLRAAIEQAMFIGELKTLELDDCTLTLAHRAGALVIVDESLIPGEFWKDQDPQLDKRALTAALKGGQQIKGATLGNGGVSLTVRGA